MTQKIFKNTVHYRQDEEGTLRLNTFDYRVICKEIFPNGEYTGAKLLSVHVPYGKELPNLWRVQIIPMYYMQLDSDGVFVKTYIRKSENVHCLVVNKDASNTLMKVSKHRRHCKHYACIAYSPDFQSIQPASNDGNMPYQVINIFPTGNIAGVNCEKHIFVIPPSRELLEGVGNPPVSIAKQLSQCTVIDLDKEQRPYVVKLKLVIGEKYSSNSDISDSDNADTAATTVRICQKKVDPMDNVEIVLASSETDSTDMTPLKATGVAPNSSKPTQNRARKSIQKKVSLKTSPPDRGSDSDDWIDVKEVRRANASDIMTITTRKQTDSNLQEMNPNPVAKRRGRTQPKSARNEVKTACQNYELSRKTTKPKISPDRTLFSSDETDSTGPEVQPVLPFADRDRRLTSIPETDPSGNPFPVDTKPTASRIHTSNLSLDSEEFSPRSPEFPWRPGAPGFPNSFAASNPGTDVDPKACVRQPKPVQLITVIDDIGECNPFARFAREFVAGGKLFDDWLANLSFQS